MEAEKGEQEGAEKEFLAADIRTDVTFDTVIISVPGGESSGKWCSAAPLSCPAHFFAIYRKCFKLKLEA